VLGKVLVTLGLLTFAFVAYLLWGTGIETRRAQSSLRSEFDELVADNPAPPTVGTRPNSSRPPRRTTTTTPGTRPGATLPPTAPTTAGPPSTPPAATSMSTASPSSTVAPQRPPTVDQELPAFASGDAVARLEIPDIGLDVIVVEGVDREDLKRGPGHYPETPFPGQLGNAAIAGHRTTFSQPFARIDELDDGDEIVVVTPAGTFVYAVDGTVIVSPADVQVVQTRNEDEARITLTSCHPRWSASQRIVVTGALVGTRSSPVGEPDPIDAPPDTLVGETVPTTVATSPQGSDGSTPSPTGQPGTRDTDGTGTRTSTGAGTAGDVADDTSGDTADEDAFAETWFSDKGAFFDIALWALPLVLIAMASSLVSRRLRAFWIGPLLAAAPFVVALYFFFQNVNRLLPAAF